jgi:hypothetical protein
MEVECFFIKLIKIGAPIRRNPRLPYQFLQRIDSCHIPKLPFSKCEQFFPKEIQISKGFHLFEFKRVY